MSTGPGGCRPSPGRPGRRRRAQTDPQAYAAGRDLGLVKVRRAAPRSACPVSGSPIPRRTSFTPMLRSSCGRRHHVSADLGGMVLSPRSRTPIRVGSSGGRCRANGQRVVADALQMAVARRRPEPGLVHHSDQGRNMSLGFAQQAVTLGSRCRWGRRATPTIVMMSGPLCRSDSCLRLLCPCC